LEGEELIEKAVLDPKVGDVRVVGLHVPRDEHGEIVDDLCPFEHVDAFDPRAEWWRLQVHDNYETPSGSVGQRWSDPPEGWGDDYNSRPAAEQAATESRKLIPQ
jgi:hypothetical protein